MTKEMPAGPSHPDIRSLRGSRYTGSGIVRGMPAISVPIPVLPGLSEPESAAASRVAARLHSDLARLVAQLPHPAQGGSGMARHLGIVRNTCQRVANALQDSEPTLDTLVKLPGVKGLEQLLAAMRDQGLREKDIQLAETSVSSFEGLVRDVAGSHAKLISRIEAPAQAHSGQGLGTEPARREVFDAATKVTGRNADAAISLYAFRPSPDDGQVLQRATVTGLYRTLVMPGGMPIIIAGGDTLHWADEGHRALRLPDERAAEGKTPEALLPEFTSQPLPTVSSRGETGNLIQVIDPATLDGPQIIDVFGLSRANHPMFDPKTGELTLDEVWSLTNCVSRRLVFDVFLHRDLERRVRPSIDAQLWYPNLSSPGKDRWVTRYPDQPRLQLLGEGLGRSQSEAWPEHDRLCKTMFERVGWDAAEFVGFRCEVAYPIWRAGYCMSFRDTSRQAAQGTALAPESASD